MRVLVVSEDPKERMRASSALTLHGGADVVEATSAKEARHLLIDGATFDVLVIDGDLYPQGGFSFLYEVRAAAELADAASAPAIVMIAREQDRFLSDWSGANELILKPVDPFALARTARAIVGDPGGSSTPGPAEDPSDVAGREVKRATT